MKRVNNIYYNNISFSILLDIYNEIKSNCRSEKKLMEFSKDLNSNLLDIENKLFNNNYEFGDYYIFLIKEPKYRVIMSESISDKIVNHLVARRFLLPYLEPGLIDSNVATRINKGSSYAYKLFSNYVNSIGTINNIFILKIDISKYFYNISHDILKKKLNNKIKDKNVLNLLFNIIDLTDKEYINKRINYLKNIEYNKGNNIESIPIYKKGYGINIGSLVSQTLAIFYLDNIDKYIKEILKCKYYIRYMDDIILMDTNKDYLRYCFSKIKNELEILDLKVNPKSSIWLLNKGFIFLGYTYRIINNNLVFRPRNCTYRKIYKKLNKLRRNNYNKYFLSIISYKGYFGNNFINYKKEILYLKNIYYNYSIILNLYNGYYLINYGYISKYIYKLIIKNNKYIILKKNKLIIKD